MSTFLLKRIFLLICVSCISTAALAATVNWDGGDDPNTPFWGIATNWDTDTVPTSADDARIGLEGAAVEIPAGESYQIYGGRVGDSGTNNSLTIGAGATLKTTQAYFLGRGGGTGTLVVNGTMDCTGSRITFSADTASIGNMIVNEGGTVLGGLLLFGDWLGVGNGNLTMNGGLVDVSQMGAWLSKQDVSLDLNDGVYDVGFLNPAVLGLYDDPDGSLYVDIDYGTWIIEDSDVTADVQTMIDRGELVGFGGKGTIHYDYDITTPGRTTVTATYDLNPSPEQEGVALVPSVVLEWDNFVEPNDVGGTVTADVWFGTDPNVYNNSKIVDGQLVTPGTRSSTAPQAIVADTTYYWQVNFDNGSGSLIEGLLLEFVAVDNDQPEVSVQNVITWLDPPYTPGNEAVVLMDATVTDDTPVEEITYTWTLEPAGDPNVAFDSTAIEDPTLTIDSTGIRTLTLTVNDGYWDVSASAEVRVYENPCWAARVSPGYGGDPAGDIANNNCIVNLADFAALAATWLDDTALTEYLYY